VKDMALFFVAHAPADARQSIGIEEVSDIESALALARLWLAEERPNVVVGRSTGETISGAELAACCRGEKKLTADLRVLDA
jgi:hypothetical protein